MKEQSLSLPGPNAADQARAWRAGLPRGRRRRSDWRGGVIFTVSVALFVLLFLGMFLLPFWWLRAAAITAQPWVIGALFVIGHDACHGSLVRTGWLNRALGRAALLPALHPYSSWVHAHNTLHHGWTCFKGREPAFPPFTKEEFDRLPLWRRLLERLYRTPPGIGVYYAIDFYVCRLLFPPPGQRPPSRLAFHLDRLAVLAFLALQLLAARVLAGMRSGDVLSPGVYAVVAVALPWCLWIWFMGFVSFIQHTHPRIAWYDREEEWSFYHVQLRSTAHVVFPWPVGTVLHNIMEHAAHHIDPAIPLYELPRSQRLLEQECPEHALVIPWTLDEFFRTCACCKLYDFRRHCWTDFNGVPTTLAGLNGRPSSVGPRAGAPDVLPASGQIYPCADSHAPVG
jgi:omega-6 fatty acid desaturase (delta-12 desaturase)